MRVAVVTFDGFKRVATAAGREVAVEALSYVLPHGEEDEYTHRALARVEPFVGQAVRG